MTLEEISAEWHHDSHSFDRTDLTEESIKAIRWHAKYSEYRGREAKALKTLQASYMRLRAEKEEFLQNPTQELIKERGWKVPPRGRILKSDLATYLNSDPELNKLELAIGIQEEKLETLKEILKQLNQRSYTIRNIIDDRKYMNGG